jgi:hypothetical protein
VNNFQIALNWARFGKVFPVYESDSWEGGTFHAKKTPVTPSGHLNATQDPGLIADWWKEEPDRLVALWTEGELAVLDIDIDLETGEDGFDRIREDGLEVPNTFWVETPSGGRHYFYSVDPLNPVGPMNNYLKRFEGDRSGVDRKSGSSYVVVYVPQPPERSDLTPAPQWLTAKTSSVREFEYTGTLSSWLTMLSPGLPDWAVFNAIAAFPDTDFGHQEMIVRQVQLVRLGAENHSGVEEALELLRSLWLHGDYNTEKYRLDWTRSLEGAVRKFGGARGIEASK